jgi:uncharacterized protein (DUF1778 family)
MNALERTETLTIRIAQTEKDMLQALADKDGLSRSDWLRLTIRRAYADAIGEKLPKRPPGR